MKLNAKILAIASLFFANSMPNANPAAADPLDSINGYLFPEIGFKNIQFLPGGHLHKNKPKYGKYNWYVAESAHFQIWTYGNDERLVKFYLGVAEMTYKEFSAKMNMNQFTDKIRIIIFNSSRDFEEANIIYGLFPKGLGGETEMIKWKRMVIAFRDSPEGFKRLLRHELMHRYQGEFLKITIMNFIFRDAPLWFTEGSAEHMSHQWDPRGELVMRDAYLNNYLASVSKPSEWYTSLVYKQGEFILHFLSDLYKDKGEVIRDILNNSAKMKFADAFKKSTGDTLEEFDKKLWRHIEQRYSPLRAKIDIADEAKSIGEGALLTANNQFFITRKFIYGRETLFLNWTDGVTVKSKKLVEEGRLKSVDIRGFEVELSPEFGFQEHGASFVSSTTLVYAMDAGRKDIIVIQNFKFNKEKKKILLGEKSTHQFKDVREIQHPVMLNDKEVAFVGRADGVFAELFVANLTSGTVRQLTSAQRTYRGLTYSKTRNELITSVENETTKSYDLAIYNLAQNTFAFLTNTPESEFYATFSPDGSKLLYVSDKNLVHNIHRYDFATQKDEILTDAKIGVFRPLWFSNGGLLFNWLSRGKIEIKTSPLPIAFSISTQTALTDSGQSAPLSPWDIPEVQRLRAKIPNVESMTLFDVTISSDKTKAIFAENRKLSMEILNRKEPEMRFHIADSSTGPVITFTFDEFKKMQHYGGMAFLQGTNVLLQKRTAGVKEVTYKNSYIYDWSEKKLYDVDTEISSAFNGNNRPNSLISPDKRYIIWPNPNKKKIFVYDIVAKEKKEFDKKFHKIQRLVFIADRKLMILDKKRDFSLSIADIDSDTCKTWDKIITERIKSNKEVAWFPAAKGTKVFFVIPKSESGSDILLFDTEKSSITLIAAEVPLVKKAELKDDCLNLTITNAYGLDRTMAISSSGLIAVTDKQPEYAIIHATKTLSAINPNVFSRQWGHKEPAPMKNTKALHMPKLMFANGVGGIAFDNNSRINTFLALQIIAYDEINDRGLAANIFLQNKTQGIANIQYYNQENGRSYILDYWNFDGYRQKLDIGVSQNIFLHKFLNWDITFKQQQIRNERYAGTIDWWRTNLGTSLSLDTQIYDCEANSWTCHGPHSGAAAFTETEISIDNKKGFQAVDIVLDARYHIPFTDRSGLSLRALGGRSFGPNPNTFIWGGNGTFRGIPLFSQAGNVYAMQSTELRFPILNAAGAIFSGPVGEALAPLTLYLDIRGGLYNDIGDIWYTKTPLFEGHQNFKIQQSAGYFINIPTALGINLRFNKGFYGKQDWNFWLGYNW